MEAQKVVDELEENIKRGELPASAEMTISQTEFIRRNLATFQRWGLPKRGIYKYLLNHGVQLSTYESFVSSWTTCAREARDAESKKLGVIEDGETQKGDKAT